MPIPGWSNKWTYSVVEEFLSFATVLASTPDEAINEMRQLMAVMNLGGVKLNDATRIIGDYIDRKK